MPTGRARLSASCARSRSPYSFQSTCIGVRRHILIRLTSGFGWFFIQFPMRSSLRRRCRRKQLPPSQVRADHPFHLWVANEVVRRFPHRCCANVAELESTDFGITSEGLIREPRRYVKDDVRSIHDVGARILGWSTDAKIAVLTHSDFGCRD